MASEAIHRQITALSSDLFRGLNSIKGGQDDIDGILESLPQGDPIRGAVQSSRAFLNTSIRQLTKAAKKLAEQIDEEPGA
jgi:hypothetical protein